MHFLIKNIFDFDRKEWIITNPHIFLIKISILARENYFKFKNEIFDLELKIIFSESKSIFRSKNYAVSIEFALFYQKGIFLRSKNPFWPEKNILSSRSKISAMKKFFFESKSIFSIKKLYEFFWRFLVF